MPSELPPAPAAAPAPLSAEDRARAKADVDARKAAILEALAAGHAELVGRLAVELVA